MLVLSRKPGETIRIGDEIVCTVLAATHNRVRLGITAPVHLSIVRGKSRLPPAKVETFAIRPFQETDHACRTTRKSVQH